MSQSSNASIPDLDQHHKQKEKSQQTLHSDKGEKPGLCGGGNRKWDCDSLRPSMGTSMIVFAVPLLLPGITLTAVAFDDDTSFAKYGALHVIGMIFLSLSGLLLLVGIFLNIRFHDKVSPEDVLIHRVSTHEANLTRQMTVVSMDVKDTSATPAVLASFMVDAGHSSAKQNVHHVTFGAAKVGAKSGLDSGDVAGGCSWHGHDFQPSSILSSPRSRSSNLSFTPCPTTDFPECSAESEHSSASQGLGMQGNTSAFEYQENTPEKTPAKLIEFEAEDDRKPESSSFLTSTIPEITLKTPELQNAKHSTSTQSLTVAPEIDFSTKSDREPKSRKKRKKKKKRRAIPHLDGEGTDGAGLVSRSLEERESEISFPAVDQSGFQSLASEPSATSRRERSNTEHASPAYKTITSTHDSYKLETLSIPKTKNGASRDHSDQRCDSSSDQQLIITDDDDDADDDNDDNSHSENIGEMPNQRAQVRVEWTVRPAVPPPSNASVEESAIGRFARVSDSTGTVTRVYSLDASGLRTDGT